MRESAQIAFSIKSVAFALENALAKKKSHFLYSNIIEGDNLVEPGVLRKHILNVVIALQDMYRGQMLVSRTPGGIVFHPCDKMCFTNGWS